MRTPNHLLAGREPYNFKVVRPKKRPSVTIAAGFVFGGGVLLCADSQFSYGGVAKARGSKVFAYHMGQASPVRIGFALSGNVKYAKEGIREIGNRIIDSRAATTLEAEAAIREAHAEHYAKIWRHPDYRAQDGGPNYWLFVTTWTPTGGLSLWGTDDAALSPITDYDANGSGWYLFRYLLQNMYRQDMSLQHIVTLATHAFTELKTYDPNIGFNSEFLVARPTGDFSVIAGCDIGYVENFGRMLQRALYELLFVMADLRSTDEDIKRARQLFADNLMNLRRRHQEDREHRDAVEKLLDLLADDKPKRIAVEFRR